VTATNISARYGRTPLSGHRQNLKQIPGGENGPLAAFLDPASLSVDRLYDDFVGLTLSAVSWASSRDGTGTIFAPLAGSVEGSSVFGVTGNVAGDGVEIHGIANWYGSHNCLMEVRFQLDVITAFRLEIGFANTRTSHLAAVVTDVDAPTIGNGATNLAVVHVDTSQTLTTMAFVTDGSTASMNPTKTNLGTRMLTAGDWLTVRVGVVETSAYCHVYDTENPVAPALLEQAYHGDVLASQVTAASPMMPFVLLESLNTSVKTLAIDSILVMQDK
jgi:hypothetical protein